MEVNTFAIDLVHEEIKIPQELLRLDGRNTAVFVFASSKLSLSQPLMEAIALAFPTSHIIAGSTYGEIFDDHALEDHAVIGIAKFEKTELRSIQININDRVSPYMAGRHIAEEFKGEDLKGIFLIYDGALLNGSKIARGITKELKDEEVPIIGGASGAIEVHGDRCWIFSQGKCEKGAVSAIAFYGKDLIFGWGTNDGWSAYGRDYKVTRSIDNVVLELDKRPALEVYKEALGVDVDDQVREISYQRPFAIVSGTSNSSRVIRTVFAVRSIEKSLVFAGDVPEGCTVQIMQTTVDKLVRGAERAAHRARLSADGLGLALAVSCAGRKAFLGTNLDAEVHAAQSLFPRQTRMIGFYSWGELAPAKESSETCVIHNQTMTLAYLKEW